MFYYKNKMCFIELLENEIHCYIIKIVLLDCTLVLLIIYGTKWD